MEVQSCVDQIQEPLVVLPLGQAENTDLFLIWCLVRLSRPCVSVTVYLLLLLIIDINTTCYCSTFAFICCCVAVFFSDLHDSTCLVLVFL